MSTQVLDKPANHGSFPAALLLSPLPPTIDGRKRWTREQCEFLENAGLLNEHYELIDGEIIVKVGQKDRHARSVVQLIAWCLPIFGVERVRTQATIEIRDEDRLTNQPEPDVFVLRGKISGDTAIGSEVLLAIEVCDSTHDIDFGVKTRLYARAGIEEYWVLDLQQRRLSAFRHPNGDAWNSCDEFSESDSVAPLCAPESPVCVASLLP